MATMNSTTTSPQSPPSPDPNDKSCCYAYAVKMATAIVAPSTVLAPPPSTCHRRTVWRLVGLGYMCHYHFERFVTTHEVDFAGIRRLSSNDKDFEAHDGKGLGSNQWKRRWNEEAAG